MEKVARICSSFAEAEESDDEFYRGLSPQERLDIALELGRRHRASLGEAAERFARVYRIVELAQG